MRAHFAPVLLLCAAPLAAQQPGQPDKAGPADAMAAGREKLRTALEKTAATEDTSFAAKWKDQTENKQGDGAVRVFVAGGMPANGQVQGTWHDGLCTFTGFADGKDELLVAGNRMLAKNDKADWRLRSGRFVDGNQVGFLPDVPLLLEQLAAWDLAVVRREVSSLDDRPIEIFSVTLNADQVAEAAWSGLLPESIVGGGNPFAQLVQFGGLARARPAKDKPNSTVDLAIFVDPATGTVHELRFRTWTKQDQQMAGGRVVFVAGGAGAAQVVGDDDDDEEEDEAEADKEKDKPLEYKDGLPLRKKSKMQVHDYTVKLSRHGEAKAPELSDLQRRLLRLVR